MLFLLCSSGQGCTKIVKNYCHFICTNMHIRVHVEQLIEPLSKVNCCIHDIVCTLHIHVLMRDEKEGRKKQARSNKQGKATQHTQGSHFS